MGADGKVKIPTQAGEGGEGVAIILGLRPVTCSGGGWEAHGRIVVGDPLKTSRGLPRYPPECLRPRSSTSGAPSSSWDPVPSPYHPNGHPSHGKNILGGKNKASVWERLTVCVNHSTGMRFHSAEGGGEDRVSSHVKIKGFRAL